MFLFTKEEESFFALLIELNSEMAEALKESYFKNKVIKELDESI